MTIRICSHQVLEASSELSRQSETMRGQVESFLSNIKVTWSNPGRTWHGENCGRGRRAQSSAAVAYPEQPLGRIIRSIRRKVEESQHWRRLSL